MIESLISSKTRLKLLLKFFLNPSNKAYLRSLEQEFGESTNGIRVELNKLEAANMLCHAYEGKKKIFSVNTEHPLYQDINSIIRKYVGLDQILEKVLERLENIEAVYLTGELANGLQSDCLHLLFIGNPNTAYLNKIGTALEAQINKRIAFSIYAAAQQAQAAMLEEPTLLLWKREE